MKVPENIISTLDHTNLTSDENLPKLCWSQMIFIISIQDI